MTTKSPACWTIEIYFDEFCAAVERCREAGEFFPADWKDAYNRLSRLRDRYNREKPNLTNLERDALAKPFKRDAFIEGMLAIRQIGEHVEQHDTIQVSFPSNYRITLPTGVSAMSMFARRIVSLTDTDGRTYQWDHLTMFEEAERRIASAMERVGP